MGVSKPVFTCKYQKFSLTVLLSGVAQPGVAHKSVAYKKKACTHVFLKSLV